MVVATSSRLSHADTPSHLAEVLGDPIGTLGLVAEVADNGENHAIWSFLASLPSPQRNVINADFFCGQDKLGEVDKTAAISTVCHRQFPVARLNSR